MLTALAPPDQVKGVVGVGHVEGVDQLELGVGDAALGGERGGAALLLLRDRDPSDLGLGEALGDVPSKW